MNTEPFPPGDGVIADPEIQITALLLGELPAEEASALEEVIARTPELAQVRARLAVSIRLTREVARSTRAGAPSVEDGPRLDPVRRARLLEAFQSPATNVIPMPSAVAPDPRRTNRREWLAMAAMLMALFTISWFATRRWAWSEEMNLAALFDSFSARRPMNITPLPSGEMAPDVGGTRTAMEWGESRQAVPAVPMAPSSAAPNSRFVAAIQPSDNGRIDPSSAGTSHREDPVAESLTAMPQLAKRYGLVRAKPAGGGSPDGNGDAVGQSLTGPVSEREGMAAGDSRAPAEMLDAVAGVSTTPSPGGGPQGGAMGGVMLGSGMGGKVGNAAGFGGGVRGYESPKSTRSDAFKQGTASVLSPVPSTRESAPAVAAGRPESGVRGLQEQEQVSRNRLGIAVNADRVETLDRERMKTQMRAKIFASTRDTPANLGQAATPSGPAGGLATFDDSAFARGSEGSAAGVPGLSQTRAEGGGGQQGLQRSVEGYKDAKAQADNEIQSVELGFGVAEVPAASKPGAHGAARGLDRGTAMSTSAAQTGAKTETLELSQARKESADTELRFRRLVAQATDPRGGSERVEERSRKPVIPTGPVTASAGEPPVTTLQPRSTPPVPQPEISTAENPFSTFSLHVSSVSFQLAAASLEKGALPDPATIRSEEFVNAFDYGDPEPRGRSPFSFSWERARTPMAHNREVLRLALKTGSTGRAASQPLNLVLLVDNSGSMERADRRRIRQECLRVLAGQLGPQDRISLVSFARTARLWADGVAGNEAGPLAERVSNLTPEGGTHLEDALALAYKTAARHYQPQGINRVVLLTDGAANLGDVAPASLRQRVIEQRQQGIALDCFGIGWEGLDDDLLEQLSRNGDGRYGFLNSPEEAASNFAQQLAGALRVAASDVKVQVEFNPRRTAVYRQVGYARHQLTQEQFRDNRVDAAELGAAEAGNAVYIVQTLPAGEGPIATVRARYREPGTQNYQEVEWNVPYEGPARPLAQAAPSLRLAAVAAAFSEWLSASPHAAGVTPDALLPLVEGIAQLRPTDPRPRLLESMIRQSRSLSPR